MAIFGAQGIRDSMIKTYRKHLEVYQQQPPDDDIPEHHAALHGALVLRYAAAYRAVPEALVWLELIPFLPLPAELGVAALAEYVVFKELGKDADVERLRNWISQGLDDLCASDRDMFLNAAASYRFAWRHLL